MDTKFEFHVLSMIDSQPMRKRRPQKHNVDRLRGQVAIYVLMAKLSVKTAKGLAKALAPDLLNEPDELEKFRRTCSRYVAGEVLPGKSFIKKISSNGADHLEPLIERCLNSAAWSVLKEEDVGRLAILEALHNSPSNIGSVLFEPREDDRLFESRLREFDDKVAFAVESLVGFDAIETFVLLAAYARSIQSQAFTNAVTLTYMKRRPALSEDAELRQHFRELFTEIDRHMVLWVSASSTRKAEVHVPWQGQMPEKVIDTPNQPPSLLELAQIALNWTDEPDGSGENGLD